MAVALTLPVGWAAQLATLGGPTTALNCKRFLPAVHANACRLLWTSENQAEDSRICQYFSPPGGPRHREGLMTMTNDPQSTTSGRQMDEAPYRQGGQLVGSAHVRYLREEKWYPRSASGTRTGSVRAKEKETSGKMTEDTEDARRGSHLRGGSVTSSRDGWSESDHSQQHQARRE
mmetsp:Transcript_12935/g.31534  ORF Transcript_12935/g.31534 Transcript_12935/m.31534 type:complete len:175 (-) Transcript_12935:42-566(-)